MFAHRPAPITPTRSSAPAMPRASLRRRGASSGQGARRRRRAARSPTSGIRCSASGQRCANRQPGCDVDEPRRGAGDRREVRGCGAPRRAASAAARSCTGGAARSAACGRRSSSTICPAYMTAIRSHISAITPRSWLTRTMLIPKSRCSSSSRLRIWSWMITSSAVVGSSASRIRGCDAIADGDQDALPHAAAELVRVVAQRAAPPRGCRRDRAARARARRRSRGPSRACAATASSIWSPTRITGLSALIGSWKIIEMCAPRSRCCSAAAELEQVAARLPA